MCDIITERIIYRGRVQGAGFRSAVRTFAGRHPLTGYVRNLPDGTVEVMVAGRQDVVEQLLGEVATRFHHNIVDCERTPVTSPETLERFDVRF